MYVGKNDWAFKISEKTGHIEMHVPSKHEYPFKEMTVVAVSLMRICRSIGSILDEYLEDMQSITIKSTGKSAGGDSESR